MDGYYGNYNPGGYNGSYDPTRPPNSQPYGQPTIGFALDMTTPNMPYCPQPQPNYTAYPDQPPQNFGSYPSQGPPQTIGFNVDCAPVSPPNNSVPGDFVTETRKQGEEAGYWTTDSSGYRVYNYYSESSNKGPGQYSNSSYTASYSYGPSNDINQGRRSPYSQSTGYSGNRDGSGLGTGWSTSSDSSRRDSSDSYTKRRAPDIPKERSDSSPRPSNEKTYSANVDLSADKAKTDTQYKDKLDKLAALMTDVSIDESDLASMRKKHDLTK